MKKSKAKTRKDVDSTEYVMRADYTSALRLKNKVAIITGGDSGIGRSIAVHFAVEGADVVIVYHKSDGDARETKALVEKANSKCLLFKGDISREVFCKRVVRETYRQFKKIDILVNNAGTHVSADSIQDITPQQFQRTFEVNIFSFYYFSREVLRKISPGGCIINTASVTAFRGSDHLIDYASTKGAIVSLTRSLAKNLADKGIRINGVAPGPIWTPLVVNAFDKSQLRKFGKTTPMGRAGYPYEVAPAFVFLASADATYITGQIIHVNGGEIVG